MDQRHGGIVHDMAGVRRMPLRRIMLQEDGGQSALWLREDLVLVGQVVGLRLNRMMAKSVDGIRSTGI
jgi:hypothetical protein